MEGDENLSRIALTALIWSAWCVLHSLLIREGVKQRISLLGDGLKRYYRLLYSMIAVLTLLLAYWLTPGSSSTFLFQWHGPLRLVQALLWIIGLAVGWLSFRVINVWDFLGVTALGMRRRTPRPQERLVTWGIYGVIRHPQFAGGLILLWARDLTDTGLAVNLVLSAYLLVAARIEEYRLSSTFGEQYSQYMAEVPRFIPNRLPRLKILLRKYHDDGEE